MEPEFRFCKSADGTEIGYVKLGSKGARFRLGWMSWYEEHGRNGRLTSSENDPLPFNTTSCLL